MEKSKVLAIVVSISLMVSPIAGNSIDRDASPEPIKIEEQTLNLKPNKKR